MRLSLLLAGLLILPAAASGQTSHDPTARVAAQREAMARLSGMDGMWRGEAWAMSPAGRVTMTQTERVGPFLDGSVRVVEGRGYAEDGSVGFNALGVISYDPTTDAYTMTSWAMGRRGDFPLRITEQGYVWEAPAGPQAVIRYTATIDGDSWREVGERIVEGEAPRTVVELNLRRVGDTSWPVVDAVPVR